LPKNKTKGHKIPCNFLMWCRWKKANKWEDVARTICRGRVWCIQMYQITFSLVSRHYVQALWTIQKDYSFAWRMGWSTCLALQFLSWYLIFYRCKPWKMCRPGKRDAAAALAAVVGINYINFIQRAYYYGHSGFCGAKVQHVLQADVIAICSLVHFATMMPVCLTLLQCLPCYQFGMLLMILYAQFSAAQIRLMAIQGTFSHFTWILRCDWLIQETEQLLRRKTGKTDFPVSQSKWVLII